jgi:hypothetical protein
LLLLVPPVRRLARWRIRAAAERRIPASAAGDVFGPSRVRVAPPQGQPPPATGRGGPAEVIEGEIVD